MQNLIFLLLFFSCHNNVTDNKWNNLKSVQVSNEASASGFKENEIKKLTFRSINIDEVKSLITYFKKYEGEELIWSTTHFAIFTFEDGKALKIQISFIGGLFKVLDSGEFFYLDDKDLSKKWQSLFFPNSIIGK